MRPYVICHMLSSLDGKINGAALKGVTNAGNMRRPAQSSKTMPGFAVAQQCSGISLKMSLSCPYQTGLQDRNQFTSRGAPSHMRFPSTPLASFGGPVTSWMAPWRLLLGYLQGKREVRIHERTAAIHRNRLARDKRCFITAQGPLGAGPLSLRFTAIRAQPKL